MNSDFYFILKALFILEMFTFLSWLFGSLENWFHKKARVNRVPCVLKTCSRTNVPCVLTCALRVYMLTCQRALYAYVPTCLACLRAHEPTCLACLRVHVQTCLSAYVLTCLRVNVLWLVTSSRANEVVLMPLFSVSLPLLLKLYTLLVSFQSLIIVFPQ